MTGTELIAVQAMRLEEMREELAELKEKIQKARSHIYCIGGPLNDNRLGYSREQMVTFQNIADALS